jgi:hypothetical protein
VNGGKSKRQGDGFKTFDGLDQQRIEMTLRCAPVISIRWWLSISFISKPTKLYQQCSTLAKSQTGANLNR